MSRISERRQKILDYNSVHDYGYLVFRRDGYTRPDERTVIPIPAGQLKFNMDGSPNRKQLVRVIMDMSRIYGSFNPTTNRMETSSGRNRSSLDIWRHAKSIYPDIDVFLIMEAIYALCYREGLFGQYCSTVHRAVFNLRGYENSENFVCREYRINFSTWRQLHEEERR